MICRQPNNEGQAALILPWRSQTASLCFHLSKSSNPNRAGLLGSVKHESHLETDAAEGDHLFQFAFFRVKHPRPRRRPDFVMECGPLGRGMSLRLMLWLNWQAVRAGR